MNILEIFGVIFSVLYLLLASRESIYCWLMGMLSSIIYGYIFIDAKLYFETILQVFYFGMAIYGWYSWRKKDSGKTVSVTRMSGFLHGIILIPGLMLAISLGWFATDFTDASYPYLDAFTTVFGILTTWLVARKKLENWVYWFVIDGLSLYLYMKKELYLTSLLFVFYLVMCVIGYINWRKHMLNAS